MLRYAIVAVVIVVIVLVGFGSYALGKQNGRHLGRMEMSESDKQAYQTQLQAMLAFNRAKDYQRLDVFLKQELVMCGRKEYALGQLAP